MNLFWQKLTIAFTKKSQQDALKPIYKQAFVSEFLKKEAMELESRIENQKVEYQKNEKWYYLASTFRYYDTDTADHFAVNQTEQQMNMSIETPAFRRCEWARDLLNESKPHPFPGSFVCRYDRENYVSQLYLEMDSSLLFPQKID